MLVGRLGAQQQRAAARTALRYQLAAVRGLTANPRRVGPWALDRVPYNHRLPPYGAHGELELAPDELAAGAGGPSAPSARSRGGAGGCPQVDSYVLRIVRGESIEDLYAVSTPRLRTPCRIVGCHLERFPTSLDLRWGLSINTSDVRGEGQDATGASLFELRQFLATGVVENDFTVAATPNLWRGVTSIPPRDYAQQLVGRTILEETAFLTLYAIWGAGVGSDELRMTLALEACDIERAIEARVVAPRAPRVAASTATEELTTPAAAPALPRPGFAYDPNYPGRGGIGAPVPLNPRRTPSAPAPAIAGVPVAPSIGGIRPGVYVAPAPQRAVALPTGLEVVRFTR